MSYIDRIWEAVEAYPMEQRIAAYKLIANVEGYPHACPFGGWGMVVLQILGSMEKPPRELGRIDVAKEEPKIKFREFL
jgi:hypothetical protein